MVIPKHLVPSLWKLTSPERPGPRAHWFLGDGDSALPFNASCCLVRLSPAHSLSDYSCSTWSPALWLWAVVGTTMTINLRRMSLAHLTVEKPQGKLRNGASVQPFTAMCKFWLIRLTSVCFMTTCPQIPGTPSTTTLSSFDCRAELAFV